MPERIYVSDVDSQAASDLEVIRISRRIVADLNSSFPGRKKKMIARIKEHGQTNPGSMIPLLLRYVDHIDPVVKEFASLIVNELTKSSKGEAALIDSLFSAHPVVADSAAFILDLRNLDGKKFRELFLDSERLFAQCNSIGVYTGDVKELFLESIRLYKSKLIEQSFENMIIVRDILTDRLDWNENTRKYIQDVLKLTPQLSQSGVSIDNISESLKILTSAMKNRDYRETRDLVETKKLEASVGSELASVFSFISKKTMGAMIDLNSEGSSEDSWIFQSMGKVAREIQNYLKQDKRTEAMESLYTFVAQEFAGKFIENSTKRIVEGDRRAIAAMGQAMIGITKILYMIMPNTASELFDTYLKARIGKENIDDAPWPPPLRDLTLIVP